MTAPGGAERRRYPRIPMSLKAILSGHEMQARACVIRDFCPGGLFLSWPDESNLAEIEAAQGFEGHVFQLFFQVKAKNGRMLKSDIAVKVVRQYHGGLGVAFEDANKNAMNLLHKIAQLSQEKLKAKSKKETEKLRQSQQTDSDSLEKTSNDRNQLHHQLTSVFQKYIQSLSNLLKAQSQSATDEEARFAYFNAAEILSKQTSADRTLLHAVDAQLNSLPAQDWEKIQDEAQDNSSALSLVDEQEFESYLALNGVISDTEADHRMLLFRLTRRVSQMYRTQFDQTSNPVGVSRLCRTIDDFLQSLEFDYAALNLAYGLMAEELVPALISFYEKFAGDEDLGSKPDEDAFLPPHQRQQATATPSRGVTTHAEYGAPQIPLRPAGEVSTDSLGGRVAVNQQQAHAIANNLLAMQEKQTSQPHDHMTSASGFPAFDQGMLGEFDGSRTVSMTELMQIMGGLHQEDRSSLAHEATLANFHDRFSALLHEQNLRLAPRHQQAVGLADNMLRFFQSDDQLSGIGRDDLQKLQALMFKQAVSDQGLTSQEANPLRHIINSLDQLDRFGANHSQQIRPQVDRLMQQVMRMDELPDTALERLHSEFENLVNAQKQSHQDKIDALAKQCDLEETFIADHRRSEEKVVSASGQQLLSNPEWMVWQNRAQELIKGDSLLLDTGQGEKQRLTLAWKNEESEDFVFADSDGNKAAKLTLRELAVRLLKGSAEVERDRDHALFDQAVVSGLFNAFDDVKKSNEFDEAYSVWNEEKFTHYLVELINSVKEDYAEHALVYCDVSKYFSDEKTPDADLEGLISEIQDDALGATGLALLRTDKALVFIFEFISAETALIKTEMLLNSLESEANSASPDGLYDLAVGVSFINSEKVTESDVLSQAKQAASESRKQGRNFVTLAESAEPQGLANVLDWEMWLEDFAEDDAEPPLYQQYYHAGSSRKEEKTKPIMHLFSAREDQGRTLYAERFLVASQDTKKVLAFEKKLYS